MKHWKDVFGALLVAVLSACGPATEKADSPKAGAVERTSVPTSTGTAPGAIQAPIYEDGDWWKVRVRSEPAGNCWNEYPEYLVKIQDKDTKVFGLQDGNSVPVDCGRVASFVVSRTLVRGEKPERFETLRFPMYPGAEWSKRFWFDYRNAPRGRWLDTTYEVESWERVKTPKGEFDALRIVATYDFNTPAITVYHYAPEAKGKVSYHYKGARNEIWAELVDYHVSQ